jgi:hypothetical protein
MDLNATAMGKARKTNLVILAKAGIHTIVRYGAVLWIPAFAGMTGVVLSPA